ncbi:hypothetical protein ACFWO0_32485, partial [Streptomyces sp. NPDC058461]
LAVGRGRPGSGAAVPWALRRGPAAFATSAMLLGALWFLVEVNRQGPGGAAERVVTAMQSLWPFVVAVSCLHQARPVAALSPAGPPPAPRAEAAPVPPVSRTPSPVRRAAGRGRERLPLGLLVMGSLLATTVLAGVTRAVGRAVNRAVGRQ